MVGSLGILWGGVFVYLIVVEALAGSRGGFCFSLVGWCFRHMVNRDLEPLRLERPAISGGKLEKKVYGKGTSTVYLITGALF